MLEVKNLTKVFGEKNNTVHALKGVNLKLYEGELVIVMGPSGSGKSTFLHILGGLEEPTSGNLFVHGKEIKNFYKEPIASKYRSENIGFVFQSFNLLSSLTAKENISLPLMFTKMSHQSIEKSTDAIIKLVGLGDRKNHYPSELSGGQQQRVAIARALVHHPTILLADEPTGNLDSENSKHILSLFLKMRDTLKQSIILVTHDPMVATYGDRIIIFRDGNIVHEHVNNKKKDVQEQINEIISHLRIGG
ncbi:ABC transporter ATP-binding protein [Bacillus thuringiensis serovar aizawai str. Leapi01]|nr:ABC transporter ATP-binding protein [Bacillus thuringiensis serovar aizawai str. Leapi01]